MLRPVLLYKGRGTRCPVCSSRYGSYDVLTPVSLGNSSALTHVSRVLMNGLPPDQRKLLVFCDSRQDAAHQARFVEASEERVRLRRLVYALLEHEREPHDLEWLVDGLHERYVTQGRFTKTKKKDQLKREKDKILGELLSEFVISPRVRAGLERMALVTVRYAGLDEALAGDAFQRLCTEYQLRPGIAAHATRLILDVMRQRMAVNHEVFKTRLFPNDKLASRFGIQVNRYIGKPAAFVPPQQMSADTRSCKLFSTWNTKGSPNAIQRLWRHLHRVNDTVSNGTAASLEALLAWLAVGGYLVWEAVGAEHESGEGYQVNHEQLEFEVGRSFRRCSVCDRVTANETEEHPCDRPNCSGRMLSWAGPIVEGNLNALMAVQDYAPPLFAAEHSAAVTEEDRAEAENGFMNLTPPRPNRLACTPTLEMGVNIGDLEAIAMRNIPPSPAHYAQRSGRTGRLSRMGIVAGFSRNTPHDGYFFDHPGEIISGAIPPPRFNLDNLEAIARHVRSLVLEHAELDIPFPSDPGSVALGYQPEPIFGGRLQAQREFAPGQIVYARGGRWRVTGVALHRPGSPSGPDQSMFKFTLCGRLRPGQSPQSQLLRLAVTRRLVMTTVPGSRLTPPGTPARSRRGSPRWSATARKTG